MIKLNNINIICDRDDVELCQKVIFQDKDNIWRNGERKIIKKNEFSYHDSRLSIFEIKDNKIYHYFHYKIDEFYGNSNLCIHLKKILRIVKLKKY